MFVLVHAWNSKHLDGEIDEIRSVLIAGFSPFTLLSHGDATNCDMVYVSGSRSVGRAISPT
jgi:hypothetical protein